MVLPASLRLRGRCCFDYLYRHGRLTQGRYMTIRVALARPGALKRPLSQMPPSPWRCAVVISGKACKRAAHRNRLRRLMHRWLSQKLAAGDRAEQTRTSEPGPKNLIGGPPRWLLVSLRPGCRDADPMDLLGECEHLLAVAGIKR